MKKRYLIPGDYMADPSVHVFEGKVYIYPSHDWECGIPEDDWGAHFDMRDYHVFSLEDVMEGDVTDYGMVLDKTDVPWVKRQMWDCDCCEKDGKYYLYFPAKDHTDIFRLGVAVSDTPYGPFVPEPDPIRGSYSIDPAVFKDDDGQYYMYYGGWGHCNMVKMGSDLISIVPFEDGTTYKEVTPENYIEGPFMLKHNGKYYFMWSEGDWTGPDYCVAYAIADSPFGPFKRVGKILEQDTKIANGAGHHSIIKGPGKDEWYIVYHRRPLGETDGNYRITCIDRMYFNKNGTIKPVKMTSGGIKARPLR